MPSLEQVTDATATVIDACGLLDNHRPKTADQLRDAGIDPQTIEHAIKLHLDICDVVQAKMLTNDPALALMVGCTLAAAYINHKRDQQSYAEAQGQSVPLGYDAALGEGRN